MLSRALHVPPRYCTMAIDTLPSTIEVALDISFGPRHCIVQYTYFLSPTPFPSARGSRRSNLHWTYPRCPGTVSGTTRTPPMHWTYPRATSTASCARRTAYVLHPGHRHKPSTIEVVLDPVLPRVPHVLPKYSTIAIDTQPSTIEVALGISSVSPLLSCVLYTHCLNTAPSPSTQGSGHWKLHCTSAGSPGTDWCTTRAT